MGSSPRVRGADVRVPGGRALLGIIPACAGSRRHQSTEAWQDRDHPRVCGEQHPSASSPRQRLGSSPRVRGAVPLLLRTVEVLGIIPACAGSRVRSGLRCDLLWDHPRACGEQRLTVRRLHARRGSSPRVRGADAKGRVSRWMDGIIPARAGSRLRKPFRRLSMRDHPRACGEQMPSAMFFLLV